MTTIFNDLPTTNMVTGAFRQREHDSVAIVSGGMDSVTLVYDMLDKGYKPHLLSFNYGQRHKKELKFAALVARHFGLKHDIVDLQNLTHLISNSALTSSPMDPTDSNFEMINHIEVPEGHYAEDNMSITVVPNRNMIMLSIAAGVAVNFGYKRIGAGMHAGDHFQYPDCRPEFIQGMRHGIWGANEGFHAFESKGDVIYAPFAHKSKADIAERGFELGVPWHMTWSCYKGEDKHCGRCGTCVERLEAIDEAKQRMVKRYPHTDTVWADATIYNDEEFWRVEVAKAANKADIEAEKTFQDGEYGQ